MKKIICFASFVFLAGAAAFGQQAQQPVDPVNDAARQALEANKDSAQQKLKEISLSKFEDAGFWKATISMDQGITSPRRMEGAPAAKKPIPDEEAIGIKEEDKYVLGIKTEFFHRGDATIAIEPSRPINIAGIAKTLSVWVVGRNVNHTLRAIFRDFNGKPFELTVGTLNFSGWKQLTFAVPPEIGQRNPHYGTLTGISFLGFRIDCDLTETYGSYYLYFDDLRVITDLFTEESRDEDDMLDTW
ncbi:MAG: flagellar filament outer layer protein FlaA [Spirochaetales bacterium]|jgi:hypothetical protein|nr:flagellar filament outer layer protein FlaA [Spirochaetales bacterium]